MRIDVSKIRVVIGVSVVRFVTSVTGGSDVGIETKGVVTPIVRPFRL